MKKYFLAIALLVTVCNAIYAADRPKKGSTPSTLGGLVWHITKKQCSKYSNQLCFAGGMVVGMSAALAYHRAYEQPRYRPTQSKLR